MEENIKDSTNINGENADNLAHTENMEADLNDMPEDDDLNAADWLFPGKSEAMEKLEAELKEVKDKHLRLIAEFDNFRRRTSKENLELAETAGKDVIQSLLVVLDDMGRAEKQIENTTEIAAIKEGLALVFNKLRTILQNKGLKTMDAQNVEFNPDLHEALTEIPAPNEDMKGKIMDVIEPGYYLKNKLIRHAKVVVGK